MCRPVVKSLYEFLLLEKKGLALRYETRFMRSHP